MPDDAPLLERLAQLPAVPAASAVELLERLAKPQADPVIGQLFGVDAVHSEHETEVFHVTACCA